MGGPGMIFSREVLRRMVPHIGECLREMYTTHEDVEVGRCVRRFGGTQCVWSYEEYLHNMEQYYLQIVYLAFRETDGHSSLYCSLIFSVAVFFLSVLFKSYMKITFRKVSVIYTEHILKVKHQNCTLSDKSKMGKSGNLWQLIPFVYAMCKLTF
uniref:Hexosyltransferase n=1 Tax=Chelonoidis abingdonii TaxID=106734 RepID=A0A8C0JES3_CHEAB